MIKLYYLPFFDKRVIILFRKAWEGVGIVASARKVIGATNSLQVELGTIRGDLAIQTQGRNVVHGSAVQRTASVN
ncbi:nucleoside diphosphate kinase 2, chloroplastic [Olea europaea subsp. europaea]|uniref:nucleoside-diphosphate kinase n=1 Tax=Olea europaea subsp. europaea TaxID=158383 RepID=A0A8S0T682_OLEEU|nr:nucleoside diphosphate kinase 2, chloroplastic [Olea europaea subsp. europaea]